MNPEAALAKTLQQKSLTKAAQSLIGICSGLTADGTINDKEISFLRTWINDHNELANTWPGSVIARRIDDILEDGIITDDERKSLLMVLQQISGNEFSETGSASSAAPFAPFDPHAEVIFKNMTFCFTGEFVFGTRAACEIALLKIDAMPVNTVTGKLDYLVIGGLCNPNWANTTYGRKIELAIERKARYGRPIIISEEAWVTAMRSHVGL